MNPQKVPWHRKWTAKLLVGRGLWRGDRRRGSLSVPRGSERGRCATHGGLQPQLGKELRVGLVARGTESWAGPSVEDMC